MKTQPFIINMSEKELPNLSTDDFEYSKTSIWQETGTDIYSMLATINEKMDVIVQLLKENGKA